MSADNQHSPLLTSPLRSEGPSSHPQSPVAAAATAAETGATTTTGTGTAPQPPPTTMPPKDPKATSPPPSKGPGKPTPSLWGPPAGLSIRSPTDENLQIFRQAVGINAHMPTLSARGTVEESRKTALGIYRHVLKTQTRKHIQHMLLQAFLYIVYFAQIIIGAALTALGASAIRYQTAITVLGVINTVLAGVLALIKGSGQPQKLGKDRIAYRRLQDWIEETEALLSVGVIGRNRQEVGLLVENAFKRYNAAKANEENNDPEFYVFHRPDSAGGRLSDEGQPESYLSSVKVQ